jgi:hypothetical protein
MTTTAPAKIAAKQSLHFHFDVPVILIKHYMITFVSDLRRVGGFFRVLQFSPIKSAIKEYF